MEIWKSIPGYKGIYECSNKGRIKSLNRIITKSNGFNQTIIGRILAPRVCGNYLFVSLSKDNYAKNMYIHQLVAMCFHNHIPCGFKLVVNHIDFNTYNNNSMNLEVVSNRVNSNQKHIKSSCKYTGVTYRKKHNKYEASITIKKKYKYLGRHDTPELARDSRIEYASNLGIEL